MNYELISLARSRYSCRSYQAKPVEEDKLEYIKECMRMAPSAVNRQPWKFRIVRSQEGREKLQSCYSRPWFNEAPLYILASVLHEQEWVRADGKHHGDIDVAIAVEHLCLAATEQGLGSCWVCNFDAQRCHELFQMPETEEPAVIIPIGYSAVAETPTKTRKAPQELFFEE
ncbi:MAG: nitroreductase family protein [Bacteroidaceae bacterium]|nr:nitroreductase family protein [Bacteroidaceae bacterium]